MSILIKTIAWLVCVYLCYALFCFFIQRQLLFPLRQVDAPSTWEGNRPGRERIWLETGFGKVEAWYMTPALITEHKRTPAVIYAHGNAELIDSSPQLLQPLLDMGLAVLMVEYPGFGRSQGNPSQTSIREAFTVARTVLLQKSEIDPARLVYFGRSLGGGVVCDLSKTFPPAALILMSTFTSVKPYAHHYLLPSLLMRDPFDSAAVLREFPGSTLIAHGRFDSIVPFWHAQALHQIARNSTLITYECDHNDCPPDWNEYWQEVRMFLIRSEILKQ
jgi:fermentation-respiration switch protein FrsA (DUF1100 family)